MKRIKKKEYQVTDGNADLEIRAASAEDACRAFVAGGDWGSDSKTTWVTCDATPLDSEGEPLEDETETYTIEIAPTVPDCCGGEHDWTAFHTRGNGGGVICTERCRYCGRYCITNTWATNPENGKQGLRSVEYRDADEDSEAWLDQRLKAAEEYVLQHGPDDKMDSDELQEHFENYFHRPADCDDYQGGLWNLIRDAIRAERGE